MCLLGGNGTLYRRNDSVGFFFSPVTIKLLQRIITKTSFDRLYVFGGRGRTRTDADIFIKWYIFFFGIHWSTGPIGTRPRVRPFGSPPPRIMILWRSIESTTQIAQLRWRNVANVGMVAVGTTTLAQRRHGRRRHNYGGATSFSQRWANVFLPTICQRCRPCWKK